MQQTTQEITVKGIDLFAFLVSDPQRAIAFYRDVLGMMPTELDDQGRGAEFTLPDGTTFGVWKAEEGQPVPSGAAMFAVDDIPSALETFRARGLKLSDPIESNVCTMSFGTDPDGNAVIIHKRKK